MTYRVIQEFKLTGSPPSQADLDRMLSRLREAAPAGNVTIALGVGRVEVSIEVEADDPVAAASHARTAAASALPGQPVRVDVEPATGTFTAPTRSV